ncbi:MAG: EthD domain-containing protein [Actinomycetota bacterium]
MAIEANPLTKMQYLIRRRPSVSRADLVANWFANHMPDVISNQRRSQERGRPFAQRYMATVFEPGDDGEQAWDGVAQLWFHQALPRPDWPHGDPPRDTFQERAEPYWPWATTEYAVVDGIVGVEPNSFNKPFPCTRSGFVKITTLVVASEDTDHDAYYAHWLDVHAPNVASVMNEVGGIRYVISTSQEPGLDPYLGMAELWFPGKAELSAFNERYESDGIEDMVDYANSPILRSSTEMIGIP